MLDWKILAASLVALLFISSLFIGGTGIKDFFSDALNKVGDFLGTSPLGGIFPASSVTGDGKITIFLLPKTLTITSENPVNIQVGSTTFSGFDGNIILNFENSTVKLSSETLTVTFPIETLNITSLTLRSLDFKETPFEIKPDISTDSGDVEIRSFIGTASVVPRGIELSGKVASFKVTIGELVFELV